MTEKLNNTKFLLSMNVKEFTKTCKHDILNENNQTIGIQKMGTKHGIELTQT